MTVIRLPRIAVNERCLLYIPRHGVDKNVSTVVGSGASNSKHYWSPSPPVRDMLATGAARWRPVVRNPFVGGGAHDYQ